MSFELDDRLARDAFVIGDLPLARVLLMNDARWPWLILVPRREGLVELTDLELADQTQLMDEAGRAARFLKSYASADKINVGALGNIVRQLHLHVVARVVGDPAWPGPVWGHGAATPYDDGAARALIAAAREGLPIEPIKADVALLECLTAAGTPIRPSANPALRRAAEIVITSAIPRPGEARNRGVASEVVREDFASDGGDHVRRIPGSRKYIRKAVRSR